MNSRKCPVALAVALVVTMAASCAVRPDSRATETRREDVPFGLLDTAASTTVGSRVAATETVAVYFSTADGVTAVERRVAAPASVSGALTELAAGPTDVEQQGGISTQIADSTVLGSVRDGKDLVQVQVSDAIRAQPPASQMLAAAQIVLTVTSVAPAARVVLLDRGEPLGVPLPSGEVTSEPVGAAEFQILIQST